MGIHGNSHTPPVRIEPESQQGLSTQRQIFEKSQTQEKLDATWIEKVDISVISVDETTDVDGKIEAVTRLLLNLEMFYIYTDYTVELHGFIHTTSFVYPNPLEVTTVISLE